MTTTPGAPTSAEPTDPELRERYRRDAEAQREHRRAAEAERAAEVRPARTPKGPIRTVAALLTLLLVAGVGLAMLGPMLKHEETSTRALPKGVDALRVSSDVGRVRVRAVEPGEEPGVTRTVTSGLLDPDVSVRTSGREATLTADCPELTSGVCRVDWLVLVPEDTATRIDQGAGGVSVEGLAGDVDVRSGVGSVNVVDAAADRVRVDLGVGDVDIDVAQPPRRVRADLGVGDLTIRVPGRVPYRVDASGQDVANLVEQDPQAPRRISATTGVGGLTIRPR
ncbi:hypothetical protein [Janibacter corallicola]|uniref:hypothetical protein n=1 Tax=Janibacter corallicola TaxID=415212 RepID=UPI0008346EFD|nr:hypothetical protein [Janibacter corallicola]